MPQLTSPNEGGQNRTIHPYSIVVLTWPTSGELGACCGLAVPVELASHLTAVPSLDDLSPPSGLHKSHYNTIKPISTFIHVSNYFTLNV